MKHAIANQPYLLLVLAPLIWGGHAVVGKLAVGDIGPITLALLRWGVAFLVLLPFCLPKVRKEWPAIKPHLPLLFFFGIFGFAGFNMLNYIALHYTTALNTALIQAAIPMLILLISSVIFRQRLLGLQIVGLLLALVGVALIVTNGDIFSLLHLSVNKGDALMLVAALMYAAYSLGLRYKPNISWASFIFVLAGAAMITVLPFAIYEIMTTKSVAFSLSIKNLLLIFYVSVLASIVAQIAYAKGVGLIGAGRAGFAINLVPVFGALMAVVFLGEAFYWFHFLGLVFVLGGIALSEKAAKRKKA